MAVITYEQERARMVAEIDRTHLADADGARCRRCRREWPCAAVVTAERWRAMRRER